MQQTWLQNQNKLHLIAACVGSEDYTTLNGIAWRKKFNPNLTYYIADKVQLGNKYADFSNNIVPVNIFVSGGYRLSVFDNVMSTSEMAEALQTAYMGLDIYVENQINDTVINVSSSYTVDLTGRFANKTSSAMTLSVAVLDDPEIVDCTLEGNLLKITADPLKSGITRVKVTATAGSVYNSDIFLIKVKNPDHNEMAVESFNSVPPSGWTNSGWSKTARGMSGSCARSAYYPAGSRVLTSKAYSLANNNYFLRYYWKNDNLTPKNDKIIGKDSVFCEISSDNGINWELLGFISEANATSNYRKALFNLSEYRNKTVKFRWRHKSDGSNGSAGVGLDEMCLYSSGSAINDCEQPSRVSLINNYPNPFNPSTNISFQLNGAAEVKLTVYNQAGEQVALLKDGRMNAGLHKVEFDGSKLNSGVYFYTLQAGNVSRTGKMLLCK